MIKPLTFLSAVILLIFALIYFEPSAVEAREESRHTEAQRASVFAEIERTRLHNRAQIEAMQAEQAALLDMERERILAPLKTAALAALYASPLIFAIIGVDYYLNRRKPLVYSHDGLLPFDREQITDGTLTRVSVGLLHAHHQTRQIHAAKNVQAVPEHYAPHITYQVKNDERKALEVAGEEAEPPLPGKVDLGEVVERASLDRILLGLGPGGERIEAQADALCHVALAGATGGGKSTIARGLLAQLLAAKAKVVMADPHFAPLDPKSGEDWQPISQRLYMPPAVKIKEIADLLAWFCNDELARRLELRRKGQTWGEPIFLYVDELPAIAAKMPTVSDLLGMVLREGRKVDVLLIAAAQDFLVKTIGGSGAVRDCYRTAYYVGGDPHTARTLLDVRGNVDDGQLGKGVVMLRSGNQRARLARVPYASNEAIHRLLPSHSPPTAKNADFATSNSVSDPKKERIRAMISEGRKPSEIVKEIWGVTGGNAYIKATDEFTSYLQELVA